MCDTCGCPLTPAHAPAAATSARSPSEEVLTGLLSENERLAAHNRAHLDAHGVFAVNLMSAPGAGKTSLLEATIDALEGELRIAVIEGDLETENDARRIRARGVPAHQITTGTACHLDARMLHEALHHVPLDGLDILFIENVGNLVCPAVFDLGAHRNVVLLSVTEGDDKPAKYPPMFRAADLVLLTKTDLLEVLGDFVPQRAERALRALANPAPLLPLSAKTGEGLEGWLAWLRAQRHRPQRPAAGARHERSAPGMEPAPIARSPGAQKAGR